MDNLATLIIALLARPEIREIEQGQVCGLIALIEKELKENDYEV